MEDASDGAQHVDGGDHDAEDGEDGSDLDGAETFACGPVLESRKEDGGFPCEVGESRKPDGGHTGETEEEGETGGGFGEATEFFHAQAASLAIDTVGKSEEEGDGDPVTEHQDDRGRKRDVVGGGGASGDEGRNGKKDVTHVHHRRVGEHVVEALLIDGDHADPEDVTEEQDDERGQPMLHTLGDEREEFEEAIESKFS